MAKGDFLRSYWLTAVITKLNNLISNYSNVSGTVDVPDGITTAAQWNAIFSTKMTAIQNDTFLGSQQDLFPIYTVNKGEVISTAARDGLQAAYNNWNKIICKNTATYQNGYNAAQCTSNYSRAQAHTESSTGETRYLYESGNYVSHYVYYSTGGNGKCANNSNVVKTTGDSSKGSGPDILCNNATVVK